MGESAGSTSSAGTALEVKAHTTTTASSSTTSLTFPVVSFARPCRFVVAVAMLFLLGVWCRFLDFDVAIAKEVVVESHGLKNGSRTHKRHKGDAAGLSVLVLVSL
jgi:hypothetical protein